MGKRSATLDDYHTLAKLSHTLPNQDVSGYLLVDPEGIPSAHLHMLHAHMTHSDKPFIGSTAGSAGTRPDPGDRRVSCSAAISATGR